MRCAHRRLGRMTFKVVLVFGAAALLGCSSPGLEPAPHQSTGHPTDGWTSDALADSRHALENRCGEHAPMSLVFTQHPLWLACTEQADRAVKEEWQVVTDAAIDGCVSSGGRAGCCFSRRTDDEDFAPHLATCERECGRRLNRQPESAAQCAATVLEAATMARFVTPTVEAAIAVCDKPNVDASNQCNTMPTLAEHLTCVTRCRKLIVRARFVEAAKMCARAAFSSGVVKCSLDKDDVRTGFTTTDCEALCRTYSRSPPP